MFEWAEYASSYQKMLPSSQQEIWQTLDAEQRDYLVSEFGVSPPHMPRGASQEVFHQIIGNDVQYLEVTLEHGEAVMASIGRLMYMGAGISMETNAPRGFMAGIKRLIVRESFFVQLFENQSSTPDVIAFSSPAPGKVIAIDLEKEGGAFICKKEAFLCASCDTTIELESQNLMTGLFGGEGFFLERLEGNGLAFISGGGLVAEKRLEPEQTIRIPTGHLVGFSEGIAYDIESIRGILNITLGGQGLHFATLTGPGRVFIQSDPFSKLAERVYEEKKQENDEIL